MYEVTLETHFSAAHRLRGYQGECEHLHGHNYRVQIVLAGADLDELGMLVDFREARHAADEVVERLDHEFLNEIEPFDTINPTTEQIARHIAGQMASRVPDGVSVREVTCWESEKCAARYLPDGSVEADSES